MLSMTIQINGTPIAQLQTYRHRDVGTHNGYKYTYAYTQFPIDIESDVLVAQGTLEHKYHDGATSLVHKMLGEALKQFKIKK